MIVLHLINSKIADFESLHFGKYLSDEVAMHNLLQLNIYNYNKAWLNVHVNNVCD